jgi:hypothetical protein
VGRYVNEELVERPIGAASLGFAMFVVLTTMASLAPKLLEGTEVRVKILVPQMLLLCKNECIITTYIRLK